MIARRELLVRFGVDTQPDTVRRTGNCGRRVAVGVRDRPDDPGRPEWLPARSDRHRFGLGTEGRERLTGATAPGDEVNPALGGDLTEGDALLRPQQRLI